ncbi:MAG: isoprenyl transferase [Clostridiales bacterium]|nr:isoprenyl transferase [Clostridiales bacterium]
MDGNGRWAKARGKKRTDGHRAGMERIHDIVKASQDIGVEHLTLYAFSCENWKRPKLEVQALFSLLVEYFHKEIDELNRNGVCIRIIGQNDNIPDNILRVLRHAEDLTKDNPNLTLNIAFNYGSRQEMVHAVRNMANEVAMGAIGVDEIDEAMISSHLYTAGQPDPDLLIRTSGEQRLSNYLLYQLAYAEFVFLDEHWPDFTVDVYYKAIRQYAQRSRRFGGLG